MPIGDLRNRNRLDLAVREEFEHLIFKLDGFIDQIFDSDGQFIQPEVHVPAAFIDVFHGDVSFGTGETSKPSTFTLVDSNGLSPTDIDQIVLWFHGPISWADSVAATIPMVGIVDARITSPTQVTFTKTALYTAAALTYDPSTHYFTVAWVRR